MGAQKSKPSGEIPRVDSEPGEPSLPPRRAEPGLGEEAVRRATGMGWDDWFRLLDAWQGTERTHPEMARHLAAEYGLAGWWAQGVTVGYERARGMRALHEGSNGFAVTVSKTFPVPAARLFAAFVDEVERDRWLESGTLRQRTARPVSSARFDLVGDETRLELFLTAKGDAKTAVALQQVKLRSAGEVEDARAVWKERLNRLAGMLAGD